MSSANQKIHTTVGIYQNGSYKVNGVAEEHLEEHIEYNKTMRFGRILMVDGEVVYEGYGTAGLEEVIEKCSKVKRETCTAPYQ